MGIRAQRGLSHFLEQIGERHVVANARAQHQGVHEKADQLLHLGARAPGNGRSNQDIILPRVAMQQDVEGREQSHEQGRVLAAAQVFDRFECFRRNEPLRSGSAM